MLKINHQIKMTKKCLLVVCLTVSSLLMPPLLLADDQWESLPRIKPMANMQTLWIAKDMKYNGLPMSIQSFQVERSADDVIKNYDRRWNSKAGVDRINRSRNKGFDVLSYEKGGMFYSMQVKAVGEKMSEGTFTVSLSPREFNENIKYRDANKTQFPIPGQATLLNRIESKDNGVQAENIMLHSEMPQDYLAEWFSGRLIEEGWVLQKVTPVEESGGLQLLLQKDKQNASIVLHEANQNNGSTTTVQVNWVK